MKKFENKIFNSDCLDIIKKIPDCSIEAIITDIPYALTATDRARPDLKSYDNGKGNPYARQQARGGFMNLSWDSDIPSLEIFKELLRITKYGGFFVTTFTTRQDRQLKLYLRLKKAGWDIGYSPLYWGYKTGFPKIANFSKLADRKLGNDNIQHKGKWSFDHGDLKEFYKRKKQYKKGDDKELKSIEAKKLDGWYNFSPKPAVEVIVCARKPSPEKSLIGNALKSLEDKKYAVGGMFVGGTEIPFEEQDYKDYVKKQKSFSGAKSIGKTKKGKTTFLTGDIKTLDTSKRYKGYGTKIPYRNNEDRNGAIFGTQTEISSGGYGTKKPSKGNIFRKNVLSSDYGRFPANLLLSGGFPEHIKKYFNLDRWSDQAVGDFCFIPKPSTKEKNSNIEGKEVLKETGSNTYNKKCLKCGKWMRTHKGEWGEFHKKYTCTCEEPEWEEPSGNLHATTKPLSLFCYLIALFTRDEALVLDPFLGSGTTVMACRLMNRKYIGIEKEKQYFEIAKKRISGKIIHQETLL